MKESTRKEWMHDSILPLHINTATQFKPRISLLVRWVPGGGGLGGGGGAGNESSWLGAKLV